MQDSKVKEVEESLEAKTTQRLAMLRIGSDTNHEGSSVMFSDPCSECGSMKRRSLSPSEEPRNKKILVDPYSLTLLNHNSAAGAPSNNSTVTEQHFQFCDRSYTRSISDHFSATTTQGQGSYLRRCNSDLIAPQENNNNNINFFRVPAAPLPIPVSLVRLESIPSPQPQEKTNNPTETEKTTPTTTKAPAALPSCGLFPSFYGSPNTALTSPETNFLQRRPSLPRPGPAPASIPSTTLSAVPKDPSTSSDSGVAESPAEKKLNRMKQRVEDMHKLWDEMLQKVEAEISAEDRATTSTNEEARVSQSQREEEGVTVVREGRGYRIHYRCNCGKCYQVYLSLSDAMTLNM